MKTTKGTASPTEPTRAGVIDIGSGHTRLVLGERQGERLRVLESLRLPVPIGSEVFRSGTMSPGAAGQLLAALERFRTVLDEYDAPAEQVVATTALREARNREVIIDWLRRRSGFDIRVLTPGDVVYYFDAYLCSRMGPALPVRRQSILTADLGSGSAHFSLLRRGVVLATAGLPLGTLRLTRLLEQTRAEPATAAAAMREYVGTELTNLRRQLPRVLPQGIVLFSEMLATTAAAVLGSEKRPSGVARLARRTTEELWRRCHGCNPAELAETYALSEDDAMTITASAATVAALLDVFKLDTLTVIQTSLAEALLAYELFALGRAQRYNKLRQQLSVARSLCYRYGADIRHARRVAQLARSLFDGLGTHLGLEPNSLNYLLIAAYLHDIGKSVSSSAHHKHSEYLISATNLFRLDEEETRIVACVARYHRRSAPRPAHPVYASLPQPARVKVQKLAALLRIADALDRSQTGRVEQLRTRLLADGTAEVRVRAAAEPLLERIAFDQKKDLYCEIAGADIRLTVVPEAP